MASTRDQVLNEIKVLGQAQAKFGDVKADAKDLKKSG